MKKPRQPAAFAMSQQPAREADNKKQAAPPPLSSLRQPQAANPHEAIIIPAEHDIFDEPETALSEPAPARPRKRSILVTIFLSAFGVLISLALGLWVDALVREMFSRSDYLGWLATGVATLAIFALLAILLREVAGIARLASVKKLRETGRNAIERDDPSLARKVADELATLVSHQPQTAAGRRALKELQGDIIDGRDLMHVAEIEVLGPLDASAQKLILDAAKRVSVVTAVSPRALVDIAYVLYEATRLIRRLADLYGARPGTLGFMRLFRDVLAHLAVTGAIAASDEFVHQIVGQGLAARLSAKLGEGVVNGMMTARIGVAAMETVRPLPFTALKRPGMSDFLAALSAFTRKKSKENSI